MKKKISDTGPWTRWTIGTAIISAFLVPITGLAESGTIKAPPFKAIILNFGRIDNLLRNKKMLNTNFCDTRTCICLIFLQCKTENLIFSCNEVGPI